MSLYAQLEIVKAAAKARPELNSALEILALVKQGSPFDELFFTQISDPSWLPLLDSEGFFSRLPEPELQADGRVTYKHHVPLMGLAQLAKSAPRDVTNLLVELRFPDNPLVGDQILRCITPISDKDSITLLAPLVVRLTSGSPQNTTGIWLNELLKVWVEAGAVLESLSVVSAYLSATIGSPDEASPGSDAWLLREINRVVFEKLTAEYPQKVVEIFFNALQLWAGKERKRQATAIESLAAEFDDEPASEREPYTYWLEDFKSASESHRELEGTLAFRLFGAAHKIYESGDAAKIADLDQLLRSDTWQLFTRLRWQLYADFPACTLKYARHDVIAQIPKMNRADCGHNYEFAQMLQAHAKLHGTAFLSSGEVSTLFQTVVSGPLDVNGEHMKDYEEHFRLKQLWPISVLLQGQELDSYRRLLSDGKGIELEDYKPFRSGGSAHEVQHVSPKETDELALMPMPQLWEFLNNWQPSKNRTGPELWIEEDFDALATKFTELVENSPERFNPSDKWWEHLKRPALLYKFLDRVSRKIEKKPDAGDASTPPPTERDWANGFGVAAWTASQRPIVARKKNDELDWTWARIVVAKFLQVALRAKHQMPEAYLPEVKVLLNDLIHEEDSGLDGREASGMGDWLTTAINSVRGNAIEALLEFALKQKNAGKEIEPWIFALIRVRLELLSESPAIFALFGSKLRLLIHLFESQLKEAPTLLFPSGKPLHQRAAILAHFGYDHPWNKILKTFPDLINTALNVLEAMRAEAKDDEAKENRRDFGSQLGTHIACYYWNGSFTSDVEGEKALDRFFAIASRSMRANLISQIATIWEKPSQAKPNENDLARVMRIWERRFSDIVKSLKERNALISDYEKELSAFTHWLGCECFSFEWRVSHTKEAVECLGKAPESFHLLESISEFGLQADRQEATLQLLQVILARPSDQLRWSIQYKELSPVISLGLASENANIKKLAEACRDLLLKMGFFEFLNPS